MAGADQLNLNRIGWTYIGIVISWTSILAMAMGLLWYHRRLPTLSIRRLPLVFIAVVMLHIYWSLCMIGYVIMPVVPCATEFWVMSIFVPFGKLATSSSKQHLILGRHSRIPNCKHSVSAYCEPAEALRQCAKS